jgi:D-inositol-3-phosphate glycosyltransferase
VVASTLEERDQLVRYYGADPNRIEIIPPGVDHRVFSPGDRRAARRHVGLPPGPMVLFVGRIQPLKGVQLAVRTLAALESRHSTLVVVGGPSGTAGAAEIAALQMLVADLGLEARVRFVRPQAHERLVSYYRAADVCIVPSHTESFGLVALEAAACGTPVVAANVGGLRHIVQHGASGSLVDGRDPHDYAAPIDRILRGDPSTIGMREYSAKHSARYRWSIAAARLRRQYDDIAARELVQCT